MKLREISGKIALIALAACLLAVPALSMPMDNSPGRQGHGAMFAPMNNLTAEEMGSMTLGELKEMQRQSRNNTTACHANEFGQNCSMDGKGMREMGRGGDQKMAGQMDGMPNHKGAFSGKDDNCDRFDKDSQGMARFSPIMLLMDGMKAEDLSNMTVNEIKALSEKKMQELDNMTLAQIKQLEDDKVAKKENMTLNQLKDENKNMRQMAKILGGLDAGRHMKA